MHGNKERLPNIHLQFICSYILFLYMHIIIMSKTVHNAPACLSVFDVDMCVISCKTFNESLNDT